MAFRFDLETIEVKPDGEVLRIWLNRPESRNAHNQKMVEEVGDLFIALNSQPDFRVAVLGGRGKSFCAGADRKEQAAPAQNDRQARYIGQLGRRAARAIEDCDLITIGRIHGHAIGGGCCFATSCDFRLTTSDALFYVPEVELGVPLPWGATPRLIHEIGAARARQMLITSERVDGTKAACSCTNGTHEHQRSRTVPPALADIGAMRLFANRCKLLATDRVSYRIEASISV